MNEVIIVVGHGSRGPEGNREVEALVEQWRRQRPELEIQTCYLEFAETLLDDGLARAAAEGPDRVLVLPLFLNAAGHVKSEIPAALERAREGFPAVEFRYGHHLGVGEPMLKLLQQRLDEALVDGKDPEPAETGVILLGRGSSDMGANGEVSKLARWLYETTGHDLVDVAFTGITHPPLETAVARQVRLDAKQVVVLPYYLFTGRLMDRIRDQVAALEEDYPAVRFRLADYLGLHGNIIQVMEHRLAEIQNAKPALNPCDGCHLSREHGHHHVHHHHHH